MQKGDTANEMFLTVSGKLLVTEFGIELPPGSPVGELGFLTPNNRRTATVECTEAAQVLTITYERLLELYFQNPQFGFFFMRLLRLLESRKKAVLVTAGLFTLAHLPNPVLMPLVFVWGLIASAVFLRWRNLYTLGMAHAILGICIAVTVPGRIDHNMRVGLGYLQYRHDPVHQRLYSQRPHTVSTVACVMAEAPTRRP